MVGWHQQLNGHEFEWALGVGDGQGGLVCCNPWGQKETQVQSLGQEDLLEVERQPTHSSILAWRIS